ncbi:MAG: tRNA uridine-5-carboxymethylaminomethyl(34) synthesis GTPase MnmE [Candidatus Eisenbacteria bacterium]|nr:tRNA uridine-5-carboxymethylaminomethyl(34) synthesis GTPase MnmE [Candidatus Eisenbacteria bacterium]
MKTDTIVALSTAPGPAALAVVRLSGPAALSIAGRCFRAAGRLAKLATRCCAVGHLVDGETPLDQVVATVFRAPETYTGEDLVEFTCHGGSAVPAEATRVLQAAGARPARPGEFTQRAFLNGRLDLAQAEAVAALIGARSAAEARIAVRALEGGLRQQIDPLLRRLTTARAQIEAALDVQEDGAPDVLAPNENGLSGGRASRDAPPGDRFVEEIAQLDRLLAGAEGGRRIAEGLRVAIVGLPNAGKSSLFNALLGRQRAIVSAEAGTTRDFLEGEACWQGLPLVLIDTAGLRPPAAGADGTADEGAAIELEAIQRTHRTLATASLVLLVVDASATSPRAATAQIEALAIGERPLILALHKWDLGAREGWRSARQPPGPLGDAWIVRSSVRGAPGVDALHAAIVRAGAGEVGDLADAVALGQRQRALLAEARDALERARGLEAENAGSELIAFELREAAEALGRLLGRRVGPELLEEIFARFCVGK